MRIPKLETDLGMEVYGSSSPGISGRIRVFPEDFIVEEVLADGSKASIEPPITSHIDKRGRYLICVLVKRNWDTLQAVRIIARELNISQERIDVAGIKDARALTAQHISIGRATPDIISKMKVKNMNLYPVRLSNEKIRSDLLYGNSFRVIIRAVVHSCSEIVEQMQNVRDDLENLGGVPNFFGHQRFGTIRPVTHLVGKQMLLNRWKEAAFTFLAQPSPYEHPESRQARENLRNTQNYEIGFRDFPASLIYEHQMLSHLARHPGDFVGAFYRLPKKLRQLFVQAYQSFLFNRFLSQRMRFGLPLKKAQKGEYMLKIDGEESLALPLIGCAQSISKGEQGEIERQILRKEGLTPESFKVSAMPEISARGGLRRALTPLIGLAIENPRKDKANPRKKMVSLGFTLGKGSYATVALREFMKPRNSIVAGF